MNDVLVNVLFFVGFIIFLTWSILHSQSQKQLAKQQIVKLIKQIGGQNIVVEHYHVWNNRGVAHFKVRYVDANGTRQRHRVTKNSNYWGTFIGDFYWDRPLQMPDTETPSTVSRSKEQIISEMDAEIKRLQEELGRARQEG
jgi:hypothetical protein